MVIVGVFPFQGKMHMVERGIEPGTSWLVVRSSDHQATRMVRSATVCGHSYICELLSGMVNEISSKF